MTVYAVASGKGGVGKTTTTVNLGTALAKAGHRTAIVDVDLGMANMADLVNLDTDDATLHEVLAGEAGVQEATYRLAKGIFAMPSAPDLDRYAETDTDRLDRVVEALREAFEFTLLDVGAGVSHETVLPIQLADRAIVVTTAEPTAVDNAERCLDLVDRAGTPVEGAVVTRIRRGDESNVASVEERLGVDTLARIPEDVRVPQSARAGRPVVVYDPDAPAAKAYARLASAVLDRQ